MKIEKVDAHHHLWRLGSSHYPMLAAPDAERFIGNTRGLKHDFTALDFMALSSPENVTRSVYVESHFMPSIEEVSHVQEIADQYGFPHAILGAAVLSSPTLGNDLDVQMRSRLFRGIRTMVNWDADPLLRATPRDDLLRDATWRQGYRELGKRGLVAEVMALPAQLSDLAALAEAEPGTPLIVGHGGMPANRSPTETAAWRSGLQLLAALPHVTIKISGLGMVDHDWTVETIRPLVETIIAAFEPNRCMFASNFPVDGMYSTYAALWDAFDSITATRATADREAMFRKTAMRIFSID